MEIGVLGEIHQIPSSAALKMGSCDFSTSEDLAMAGKETDGAFWCPTQNTPKPLRSRQFLLLRKHQDPMYLVSLHH